MAVQPSNSWTIQLLNDDGSTSGTPATLASLGIESAVCDENNMAADVLTLTAGGMAIDAATLWPYGQLLALIDPSGVRRFFGRVAPWSRAGTPDKQDHIGRIVNPWWYLENLVYQQRYNFPVFNADAQITGYTNYSTARVVLYILYNGAPQNGNPATGFYSATTGQQIADAINWAIAKGAPIQIGQMDPATEPFSSFQKGIACSEVLKHAFRFEPDFSVVWDYTTTPFPTIHCLKQSSFVPLTIDLTTATVREEVTIQERPDWQKSYVTIWYDETQEVGNETYLDTFVDYYPNPLTPPSGMSQTEFNFRGVDLFCDLSGEKVGIQNQQANFASVPFDIASLATWYDWKPHLNPANDPTITGVVILTATSSPPASATQPAPALATLDELNAEGDAVAYDETCTNEVVDGSWADWIPNTNGQRVRATAWVQVTYKAAPNQNPKTEIVPVSHDFTAVNVNTAGISENFTQATSAVTQYAEPVPYGLAQSMWTSWQALALEGSFKNVEAVVGATQPLTRKNCLNFNTPNQPAWASVNAVIQRMTWDIGKGTTSVKFGAPLHLTGNELIDAMRATRFRITTIDLAYLFGGQLATGSGTTRMARKHHVRNSQHGEPQRKIFQVSASADPSNPTSAQTAGTVTIDPTITTAGVQGPLIGLAAQDILTAFGLNPTAPTS